MGQVNLYKIDRNKKDDFLDKLSEKFECIGEKDYNSLNNEEKIYTVGTYVHVPEERKIPEWQWILDEYDYEIEGTVGSPRAVLVIESVEDTYAVTYGFSYFAVDKYCDIDFAFDFARRIVFKQIKTTTLTAPNAQRNKMINVYLNYNDISFDSGESYAKIKAKMKIEDGFTLHGEMIEIGHSIKTQLLDNSIVLHPSSNNSLQSLIFLLYSIQKQFWRIRNATLSCYTYRYRNTGTQISYPEGWKRLSYQTCSDLAKAGSKA